MADIRGTPALVVDDAHLVLPAGEREHRAAVDRKRVWLVGLDIWRALRPVEHIVRREIHHGRPQRDDVARSLDVHAECGVAFCLRAVDIRPSSRVKNQLWPKIQGLGHVIWTRVCCGESLLQGGSELPLSPGYEDARSRSERIGDRVLQMSRTRGSSHGMLCSSASDGSYSAVTW